MPRFTVRMTLAWLFLSAFLTGCAGYRGPFVGQQTTDQVMSAPIVQSIASDLAVRIASDVPPASTVFGVTSSASEFHKSLAGYLRISGFGVSECSLHQASSCGPGALPLAASLSSIGSDSYYVTASVNGRTWHRAYVQTANGLHYASFWSRANGDSPNDLTR